MIKITRPEQFKTTQWKNGLGETTELAISSAGQLNDFDWRISIATMTESGEFSPFDGFQRHLLLLSGSGLKLVHDKAQCQLLKPLELAVFDGANQTVGELVSGSVQNFNVMTKQASCEATVTSHQQLKSFEVDMSCAWFIYASKTLLSIKLDSEVIKVNKGCMAQVSNHVGQIEINGSGYVVVRISAIKNKN